MMTTKDNPRGTTLTRLAREGVDFDPLLSAEEVRAISRACCPVISR